MRIGNKIDKGILNEIEFKLKMNRELANFTYVRTSLFNSTCCDCFIFRMTSSNWTHMKS